MENPGFIGVDDIKNTYLPMGFSNFKIEGRGLGSAMILEFLLYYIDEANSIRYMSESNIYLDNMLEFILKYKNYTLTTTGRMILKK